MAVTAGMEPARFTDHQLASVFSQASLLGACLMLSDSLLRSLLT
jgi:hypothetical protein